MLLVSVSVCARAYTCNTNLQTPVTLCREQSIRGYVSKESMLIWVGKIVVLVCKEGLLCTLTPLSFLPILTYFPYLHNHEYFALDRVLLVCVCVCVCLVKKGAPFLTKQTHTHTHTSNTLSRAKYSWLCK